MKPQLSVVIPTRDRPGELTDALASIAAGSLRPEDREVLVVDNSPDGSAAELVTRMRGVIGRLEHLQVPQPGLHEARHAGLRAARADLLVFADDDIVAGPRWLEAIAQEFADPAVMLVGGSDLPRFEATPPGWLQALWEQPRREGRCLEALSLVDLGPVARDIPPQYVFGCNFAVRRSALESAGGFNPDGFPAERLRLRGDGEGRVAAYVRATGGRTRFSPGATVHHRVAAKRMTDAYFAERSYAEGVSDSYSLTRQAGALPAAAAVSQAERAAFRRTVRLMLTGPGLAVRRLRWWRAWREGFRFHQREAARDSALLEWVLRPTYRDHGAC